MHLPRGGHLRGYKLRQPLGEVYEDQVCKLIRQLNVFFLLNFGLFSKSLYCVCKFDDEDFPNCKVKTAGRTQLRIPSLNLRKKLTFETIENSNC